MTLLDTLKQMKELGWEFKDIHYRNFEIVEVYNYTFLAKDKDSDRTLIATTPESQEVEDAVVEILKSYEGLGNHLSFTQHCDFDDKCFQYFAHYYCKVYEIEHSDRLIAVCQLWIKLKEVK